MNIFIEPKKDDFSKVIEFFKKEITNVRTGRANPGILVNVQVTAYGVKNPLNAVAGVNVQDGQSLTVAPYDRNITKDIEKAIIEADLGLGVVNEGDKIRLTVPKMTEENRRDLVKKINEKMEAAKIAIRQIRDEIKKDIEETEENKEISEDEKFRFIKELDEEVGRQNDELKELRDKKEEEIMTI